MKKIILAGIIGLISGFVNAQDLKEAEVPSVVKAALAKSFPKAKEVNWSKESATEFEAEFKKGICWFQN